MFLKHVHVALISWLASSHRDAVLQATAGRSMTASVIVHTVMVILDFRRCSHYVSHCSFVSSTEGMLAVQNLFIFEQRLQHKLLD